MTCPKCSGPMVQLFTSWACKNDCDTKRGHTSDPAGYTTALAPAGQMVPGGVFSIPNIGSPKLALWGVAPPAPVLPPVPYCVDPDIVQDVLDDIACTSPSFADHLTDYMKKDHEVFIAGGFIRDIAIKQKPKDLDIFCLYSSGFNKLVKAMGTWPDVTRSGGNSAHLVDFRVASQSPPNPNDLNVQVIFRNGSFGYTSNRMLIEQDFDFTCNMAGIWYDHGDWQSWCHSTWDQDCVYKDLNIGNANRVSLSRLVEFARRGWRFTEAQWKDIAAQMVLRGMSQKHVQELVYGRY